MAQEIYRTRFGRSRRCSPQRHPPGYQWRASPWNRHQDFFGGYTCKRHQLGHEKNGKSPWGFTR